MVLGVIADLVPQLRDFLPAGVTTFRAIAAALNDRGVRTARGGDWHDLTVRNLLAWASDLDGATRGGLPW